jgi:DNA polymerase-3 subunit alpha
MIDFCHLHVHNEYSMLDGFGTAEAYAKKAARLGHKYLGLTNHGAIDGLIKFQQACAKHEIVPILGCEGYIVPDDLIGKKGDKRRGHVSIWIKDQTGFNNLCRILSFANDEGFYYRPRISYSTLLENCEGLVIATACMISWVNVFDDGEDFFYQLQEVMEDDLYCEIMPHDMKAQRRFNDRMLELSEDSGAKVICTNDCHYVARKDEESQEVLLAIQSKAKWDDKKRWKFAEGMYMKSAKAMKRSLKKQGFYSKKYLTNTIEIAKKCAGYTIPKRDIDLPRVPHRKVREDYHLWRMIEEGFKYRFGQPIEAWPEYLERATEEYTLIKRKKFTRYFLIVQDLIAWCKKNRIFVGPGRGSVGGSLIAYLIGITSVDPIKYNLIFSRFINEDRIDYPDIDIDFEDTKRQLVRQRLETLYGAENVAGVSSFNRMKAKAVLKDVGRVFDVEFGRLNSFTKLVEDNDDHTGIQMAIATYPECKDFAEEFPEVIKHAKKLEGQVRGYSQHAAAIVLSRSKIGYSGRCALLKKDDLSIVNWEKEDTEYVGLMKLDVLGLKQLSILSEALRLIKENHDKDINLERVNLEDKAVLKEINAGNSVGVFQFNTYAMTSLIAEMGCSCFDHMTAATALVRPGPANSGMTDEYIRRKHGGKWEKKHESYEEITKETYGVIVYQEQVMEVIYRIGGLPYSTADKIRKIIGKKRDAKEFRKYKKKFVKGCAKKGYFSESEAEEFWKALQEHAKYSFNKSHSVEYAMIGYWCAWLKKYFPTEFICASLTYGADNKKKDIVEEAYRLGLTLVLPKVGISQPLTWTAQGQRLYIPFIEVKGIGEATAVKAASNPESSKSKKGIEKIFNKKVKKKKNAQHSGKLGEILKKIGAYDGQEGDGQISSEVRGLFDFRVVTNPKSNYSKLYSLFDSRIRLDRLDEVLSADTSSKYFQKLVAGKTIAATRSFRGFKGLLACDRCSLRAECTRPVPPSVGRYNFMIVGQDPGYEEDEEGEGFIGRSGRKIWKTLGKKFPRKYFHVTNVNKCYPSKSRKSNPKQVKVCSRKWLRREIKQVRPCVILAFGANAMQYFSGRSSGITQMSGKTMWNEEHGAWVVYSVHPAATLHNPDNEQYYKAGMKTFKKLIKLLLEA